jgi:CRISPR-associated protein Cas5d
MKVERVSYDVITPSAARGLLEAIYWKPQIRWVVDKLHVLNPILFTSIRRNELASKASAANAAKALAGQATPLGVYIEDERQQRAAMILRDVAYAIEAHFELIDQSETIEKHYNMFTRRAQKGQCFHRPYLGCREFPANFAWIDGELPKTKLLDDEAGRDLGFMLLDIDYVPDDAGPILESSAGKRLRAEPRFFRALMQDGIITVPPMSGQEVRS